ncbi:MAG: site-specific integrase [Rhodospirillales bacterium]|nr:MAG: site-specific integrase [Rhodospirillales bacterium]
MSDRLTKRSIDAARPGPREVVLWDGEIRGFGLRIRPSGVRSFVYVYRPGGGRASPKRRVTIGSHGEITLEDARLKAKKLAGDVAHDRDPAKEKRAKRRAKASAAASTVAGLVPLFAEQHHRARGNRWADEAERTLKFDAVRKWGSRSVAEIEPVEITRLLREVATQRGAPVQARRLYIALSRFFRWCATEGYCSGSPMVAVEAPAPERARDRVISDEEIALMWRAADRMSYPFGPCVQLLILTGARRNEIAEAERGEFDLDAATWLLPAARSKNKRPHLRHLSPLTVELLKTLPELGQPLLPAPAPRRSRPPRDTPLASSLLFSTNGSTAVSGFSKVRTRLQLDMTTEAERLGIAPPADDWTFHDLRRSMVTWLAGAGFAIHVADKVLGHVSGAIQGVTAIYQRNEFLPERKAAMLAWGEHVAAIVSGREGGGNAVALRGAKSGG